jgi:hypothetical protein
VKTGDTRCDCGEGRNSIQAIVELKNSENEIKSDIREITEEH